MSELNIKYGGNERSIRVPATVADAIKAFDRDGLKKALAAKVNGEEVDLNRELTATDEVLSIEPVIADSDDGLFEYSRTHGARLAPLLLFELAHEGRSTAPMKQAAHFGGLELSFQRWARRLRTRES